MLFACGPFHSQKKIFKERKYFFLFLSDLNQTFSYEWALRAKTYTWLLTYIKKNLKRIKSVIDRNSNSSPQFVDKKTQIYLIFQVKLKSLSKYFPLVRIILSKRWKKIWIYDPDNWLTRWLPLICLLFNFEILPKVLWPDWVKSLGRMWLLPVFHDRIPRDNLFALW